MDEAPVVQLEEDSESVGTSPVEDSELVQTPTKNPEHFFGSRIEFLFTGVGYAVGMGSVWRFPFEVLRGGGGTFLIPYSICILVLAIPMIFLELEIGIFSRHSLFSSFDHFSRTTMRKWKGIGLAAIITTVVVGAYYNVIISWNLLYAVFSFGGIVSPPVPWHNGTEAFFQSEILQQSKNINVFPVLVWEIVLSLFLLWVLIFFAVFKGVKLSGKVAIVTVSLPYFFLILLLVRSVLLDGSEKGLAYFITPKIGELFSFTVWYRASVQALFQLGPGWGVWVAFGSYLPSTHRDHLFQDVVIISLTNVFTGLLSGCVVFSALGFLASEADLPIDAVATAGPDLIFITFPTVLAKLPAAGFFSIAFFFTMIMLGIDSMFGICEAFINFLHTLNFFKRFSIEVITLGSCVIQFLLGLFFCTNSGPFWIDLFDRYTVLFTLFITVGLESYLFSRQSDFQEFFFQKESSLENISSLSSKMRTAFWFLYKWVIPAITLLLLCIVIVSSILSPPEEFSPGFQAFGFILSSGGLCCILFCVLWEAWLKSQAPYTELD